MMALLLSLLLLSLLLLCLLLGARRRAPESGEAFRHAARAGFGEGSGAGGGGGAGGEGDAVPDLLRLRRARGGGVLRVEDAARGDPGVA